jgi:hypothetical protein
MHSFPSLEFTPGYVQRHLFPVSKYTQTVYGGVGRGGGGESVADHILQDFIHVTKFRAYGTKLLIQPKKKDLRKGGGLNR